jgi:hypothetical protein
LLTGSVQGYLPVEANGVGEARQDPAPKRLVTIDGNHSEVGEDAPPFTVLREAAVNHADFAIPAMRKCSPMRVTILRRVLDCELTGFER